MRNHFPGKICPDYPKREKMSSSVSKPYPFLTLFLVSHRRPRIDNILGAHSKPQV